MEPIAFYLPQFHAIAENDLWWGKGFTEWDNVKTAIPYFTNHYQPHVPHKNIGYYNLLDQDVVEYQHSLAYNYGVKNFCYYYYNFSGKTLLEKPLKIINENQNIKNNFCLCWANQDWTRIWYGQNKDILIKQEYSIKNAAIIFKDMLEYFLNPRYIKIDNKPLLLTFSPDRNSLINEYSKMWREMALNSGFAGIYLIGVEAMSMGTDPVEYGFDAGLEFAPDWSCAVQLSKKGEKPRILDYSATVKNTLKKPVPPYTRLRCVFPGWDNTPRYKQAGIVFSNYSPGAFKYAIDFSIKYTQEYLPQNLHYIFINAWNEWGEGCHIEPDEHKGYLNLKIIRQAFKNYF